jgi:hypothetical protein
MGQIHYKGHWKGWAMKIVTSLGPEMSTYVHKITNVPVFFIRRLDLTL